MTILGSDKYRYQEVSNWVQLPTDWILGEVVDIAVDGGGCVYIFSLDDHPMMVFEEDGQLIRSLGEGLFTLPHVITIDKDGFSIVSMITTTGLAVLLQKESCSVQSVHEIKDQLLRVVIHLIGLPKLPSIQKQKTSTSPMVMVMSQSSNQQIASNLRRSTFENYKD